MTDQNSSKRKAGRPGTYANASERAKAWRQRQRDLIAQAQQAAAPVIVEKIVEKRVEIPVTSQNVQRTGKRNTPKASNLLPALQNEFGIYGGEDRAKRLRVNAAKAAGTAREVLGMLNHKTHAPEAEKAFLEDVVRFFDDINGLFQNVQNTAKHNKARAMAEQAAQHEAKMVIPPQVKGNRK